MLKIKKGYPRYKSYYNPDRTSWIKEIPEGWTQKRIGFELELITGFAFHSEHFSLEDGIKLVRGDNVTEGNLRWGDKLRMWPEITEHLKQFLLQEGDVLIGMDGSKVGKNYALVKESDLPLLLVQRVARLRSGKNLDPKYLYYCIGNELFLFWVTINKTDPMIPHITPKDITNFEIAIPQLSEQRSIANFLDKRTKQIDDLIEQKEKLLQLLTEKRTAIITQVVTKGLDPKVKMKDSGIEWLGEVPEHWKLKRLRFLVETNPVKSKIELTDDALVSFVPMESVGEYGGLILEVEKEVSEVYAGYTYFKDEDVVIAKITPCFENGKGALAKGLKNGVAFGTTELHVLRRTNQMDSKYIFYLSISDFFRKIGESWMYGAGGQKRVPEEFLKDLIVPAPEPSEQEQIGIWLDGKITDLKLAVIKIEESIVKLKDYRNSLITSAITGQIDVRKE